MHCAAFVGATIHAEASRMDLHFLQSCESSGTQPHGSKPHQPRFSLPDRNYTNRSQITAPTLTAAADITHPRRCPGQVHPTAGKKLAPLATRAEPQFNLGMPESALHQFGKNGLYSATSLSVRRCGADFHFPAPPNVPVIPFPSSTVKMRSTADSFPFSTTPSGQ
jgi:hypothetical protein